MQIDARTKRKRKGNPRLRQHFIEKKGEKKKEKKREHITSILIKP
jgi:hypothetical protein